MYKRWILALMLISGTICIDQATKQAIIETLDRYESVVPIPFAADILRFTHSYNTGAAFGLLPQAGDLFLYMALAIVIGMLIFYGRIAPEAHITRMGIALICGGALGNAIDRLQHGHVTDFIQYSIPSTNFSNISNLADHAIVIGVLLVILESWRLDRQVKPQSAESPVSDESKGTENA
ncbi:MAG: signal peptidase II [Phototrophicales bacterium]|nr:signal peptidase II [Phototrophicales bacterium]